MTLDLREAFDWFRSYTARSHPDNAEYALDLARSEIASLNLGWYYERYDDPDSDDIVVEHLKYCRNEADEDHTVEIAGLFSSTGQILGSLSALIDLDEDYLRFVVENLALEAFVAQGVSDLSRVPALCRCSVN